MDPKLLAYMETLSPNEKAIFEQMVNEEMNKLSSDFKSSATIDSDRNNNYPPSKFEPYGNKSSSNSSGKPSGGSSNSYTPQGKGDERQNAKDKRTQYRSQLDEAAARPAIADQRVSLHSQRQMKQQNDNSQQYSIGNSDNSVLNIGGNKVGYNGSPRGHADPNRSEEYSKKKMAQEAYSKQLAADMEHKPPSHGGGSNRGSSRELQQRLVESNYVSSSRTDLFGGMGANSSQRDKQSKYAYDLAMDAKRNKEVQNDNDRNQYVPQASSKPSGGYNNGNSYMSSDPYQGSGGNSYAPANYSAGGSGGNYDGRVKEYDAYNIPGLSGGGGGGKGSSPLSSFVNSQSKGNAPSTGYSGGGNDYNYAAQSPIYTSKAKSASSSYQQQSGPIDSIDRHLGNPPNGGYMGVNTAIPPQYSNGGNYAYGGNNSGPINGGNPIKSPSVGRGRSSGGGQSSIQLF